MAVHILQSFLWPCVYRLKKISQQTRDIHPMLFQCWATVFKSGPTLKQHWVNALCLLGYQTEHRLHSSLCSVMVSGKLTLVHSIKIVMDYDILHSMIWFKILNVSHKCDRRTQRIETNVCLARLNPLSPHDALKHHFTFLKIELIFLQLGVLVWKSKWNWFTNTWQFSLIFKPHQIIFIHYKSRIAAWQWQIQAWKG